MSNTLKFYYLKQTHAGESKDKTEFTEIYVKNVQNLSTYDIIIMQQKNSPVKDLSMT